MFDTFDLYYNSVHRNAELQNDLQQARNEIKLLNKQIDNLQRMIGHLCEENIMLRHELNEVKTMTTIYDDCSKEELLQIVSEMQKDLNDSKKENKDLQFMLDAVKSDLVGVTNDYKQAINEVKVLDRQLDIQNTAVNDLTDIVETSHKIIDDLKEENKELKFRIKMLIKVNLNSIYGLCNVLDNTKETKDNDSNN